MIIHGSHINLHGSHINPWKWCVEEIHDDSIALSTTKIIPRLYQGMFSN